MQTMYAGKYMNMYGWPGAGGVQQVPAGWDSWHGLVSCQLPLLVLGQHYIAMCRLATPSIISTRSP